MNEIKDQITEVLNVWSDGTMTVLNPLRHDPTRDGAMAKSQTGVKLAIATRWTFQGKTHEHPNCPKPIPDMRGLVYVSADRKSWVVLNPDASLRTIIRVPRVRPQSHPDAGYLGDPQHLRWTPPFVMYGEGSDGHRDDCCFYFDLRTGALLRADFLGRY